MTTTTINPEVTSPAAVISSGAKRSTALLRSFWFRIKAMAAPAFTTSVTYIKGLVSKAIALVPHPVAALAAPLLFVTRFGYGLVTKAMSFVASLAGMAVSTAARVGHNAINWIGERVADFVGLFSQSASKRVELAVQHFSILRIVTAQKIQGFVSDAATRVGAAFQAPTTRGAVAVTSGAIAGVIGLNAFAPATFSSTLAALPASQAATVAGISMGGWSALLPIAGVAVLVTLLNLVTSLLRRPKALEPAGEQTPSLVPAGAKVVEGDVVEAAEPVKEASIELLEDGSIHAKADGQEVVIPAEQTQEGMLKAAAEAEAEWKGEINSSKKSYPAKPKQRKKA